MDSVGVYLHVPFCERVCPYCDFAVVAAPSLGPEVEERYAGALARELRARAPLFAGRRLASLYFGGGTPSLLQPASIARLVAAVRETFPGEPEEVTLEVNPGTLVRERLAGFREAGVDRLSLGIQSFDDRVLHRLGRAHRAEACHATLDAARAAGFSRLSIDLIFGVPGQTLAGAVGDVDAAVDSGAEHVSAYGLTVEEGTPLARGVARGTIAMPSDDEVGDAMEAVAARLEGAGLRRYEISSYARPGREARHNRRYWQRRPVLGVGVGAHGLEPPSEAAPWGARPANERSLGAWLARVAARPEEPPFREVLSLEEARGEAVFLGLRRREGLDAEAFATVFDGPPRAFFEARIELLLGAGLLAEAAGGDLALTHRGWLLADEVASHFVGAGEGVGGEARGDSFV